MENGHNGFTTPLLLAFIAIILIGGGAYVYVQKKQVNLPVTENVTLSQATPTMPATNHATSEVQTQDSQTENWKTYNNTRFNYSFRYPSDLGIDRSSAYKPVESPDGLVHSDQSQSFTLTNFKLDPSFFRGLFEPGQMMIKGDIYEPSCESSTPGELNGKEVIIDGVKSIKYVHIPDGAGGDDTSSFYGYWFQQIHGGNCFLIMLLPYPTDPSFIQKFDQIVSTFKFNP